MSIQTQKEQMKAIVRLLRSDLPYCYGEHEDGPNGNKRLFLDKSAAFLRALAKDLEFTEYVVSKNTAGIAVSGDFTLMGVWQSGGGVYLNITESYAGEFILYREIEHLKDYIGKHNQYFSFSILDNEQYEELLNLLWVFRRGNNEADCNAA